jgi:hypothetical protein
MVGRKRSHSESRWALLPPTVIRCNGTLQSGKRCRREAVDGSVVCDIHGGAAPQVRPAPPAADHDGRPAGPDAGQDDGGHRGAVRGSARRSPKISWTARVWWRCRFIRSFR